MKNDMYVVIGQYSLKAQEKASPVLKELIEDMLVLGEVNVFDLPSAEFGDTVEHGDQNDLHVHHYACLNGKIENTELRLQEMVRDIVSLGAKECYLDYDIEENYLPIVKGIHTALRKFGIKTNILNKRIPFRFVRNFC